jgi:hypothetical protein
VSSWDVPAIAVSSGRSAEAALRLVGGIAADWKRVGANVTVRFWSALMDRHIAAARAQLGVRTEGVWSEGLQLPFDEVIKLAFRR